MWFDGYDGEKYLLFDDYRGELSMGYLLQVCDKYPLRVEKKGATVAAEWERVYFTSNLPVELWYPYAADYEQKALWRRIKRCEEMTVKFD